MIVAPRAASISRWHAPESRGRRDAQVPDGRLRPRIEARDGLTTPRPGRSARAAGRTPSATASLRPVDPHASTDGVNPHASPAGAKVGEQFKDRNGIGALVEYGVCTELYRSSC